MSERLDSIKHWIEDLFKTGEYKITPASEDASFRSYYRLAIENNSFIIMDAPPEHEDCELFIDITNRLQNCAVNVPVIHKKNIKQGFLLLTDFGDELYLDKLDDSSADQLYRDAIKALVKIQTLGNVTGLPGYDETLLRHEISLFTDWLIEKHLELNLDESSINELKNIFDLLVNNALEQPQVFVHRDYHSRNLMRTQHNNPGIIDYQDAVCGPVSYDLVSLLKDCYIKWPANQISVWLDTYINEFNLMHSSAKLEPQQFQRWFDLMGVQRHLKASGIFARLSHRDGKHAFLKDIPRTLSYITDLELPYPELIPLCSIINEHVLPNLQDTG